MRRRKGKEKVEEKMFFKKARTLHFGWLWVSLSVTICYIKKFHDEGRRLHLTVGVRTMFTDRCYGSCWFNKLVIADSPPVTMTSKTE